ncbi:SGNH/GDSL hydrolase family protein [Pelagicoccus mobilis]|uniref:SGNH/GDSL hydrolase family protein n=1 Tax=Pelagicoccus mobilis TaxID=415221 RepID=A0A934RYM7_9BACT|nr:SGNH/GDSL hydrolase family protein [Pelagicoccus mobilis]MBK1877664.1 SGNH/GDSL hydrolase family protein [Pelagicoccus mobilis]
MLSIRSFLWLAPFLGHLLLASPYPKLAEASNTQDWGRHIQRSMGLLAESAEQSPNQIRILFYGQSIMGGKWSDLLMPWVEESYPHADIEWENRAIGGFASQNLIRVAEHDLYPFQPDLLIFHVYGHHERYEEIIHNARQRTTAEIMLITDHWRGDSYQDGEYNSSEWTLFMAEWIERVAKKYDCELVEIRRPWKHYLESNQLKPADLLSDNIHLNDHGKWLMRELVKRQLIYHPHTISKSSAVLSRELVIGRDLHWKDGQLTLEFTGNRIDLLLTNGHLSSEDYQINGLPPAQIPELFSFSRPGSVIPPHWPSVMRVSAQAQLSEEEWQVELVEVSEDMGRIRFKVFGSQTGFDGESISTEDFVSQSGKVCIAAADWTLKRSFEHSHLPATPGMHFTFRSYGRFKPELTPSNSHQTLFSGLPNGPHVLTVRASDPANPPKIESLTIHRPPVPYGSFVPMPKEANETKQDSDIFSPTPD